ncbi:MAG: hypothetical protein QHC90_28515 [Shinella sp.]|nr:hypothetical protein [Shinella sp.]
MHAFRSKEQRHTGRIDLLPPDKPARRTPTTRRAVPEIVDAEFVVLAKNAARRVYNDNKPARPAARGRGSPSAAAQPVFRASLALISFFERLLQFLPARTFSAVVAFTFIAVFTFTGGMAALHAALVPSRPALAITDVTSSLDEQNGMRVLSVYGAVENHADIPYSVPVLAIETVEAGRRITRRVELSRSVLAGGERGHFALRVPHKGGKLPKIEVSFASAGAPAE